jgi:hypothetical protein
MAVDLPREGLPSPWNSSGLADGKADREVVIGRTPGSAIWYLPMFDRPDSLGLTCMEMTGRRGSVSGPIRRTVRLVVLFGCGGILFSFLVLVVNRTAQVVHLATTIRAAAQSFMLVVLVTDYAALLGAPVPDRTS